jgi:hypothetical protein
MAPGERDEDDGNCSVRARRRMSLADRRPPESVGPTRVGRGLQGRRPTLVSAPRRAQRAASIRYE